MYKIWSRESIMYPWVVVGTAPNAIEALAMQNHVRTFHGLNLSALVTRGATNAPAVRIPITCSDEENAL